MRILLINYEFPPIGGGGANANYYILRELAGNKNFQVDVVTSSETASDVVIAFSDNIVLHRLNVGKKRLHYWTQREILTFLYRSNSYVKTLMKERSYDLCHAFFGFPSGYIAYRFRKEIPYIVSLRGSDVPGFNKRFLFQYLLLKPLFKRIWRASYRVIANSEDLKSLAEKTTPELPIEVIYNGIDIEEFTPSVEGEADSFSIICVSRLIQRKCVDYLLRAMPVVIGEHPHVHLVIVGEGDMEEDLKKLSKELGLESNVSFRGYVRHEGLPELYRNADLFVLPSLWEGMSNTLLEAMATGLPVIVTDTGGTAELVSDNGIVVPKQNSEAISEAILRLINDSSLRVVMGRKSRSQATVFSWKNVALKYLEIYEEAEKC